MTTAVDYIGRRFHRTDRVFSVGKESSDAMKTYIDDLRDNGCQPLTLSQYAQRMGSIALLSLAYNQGARHPSFKFRMDCAGWWCYLAGIYLDGPGSWGGLSTATLATYGAIYPISMDDAGPGDALGLCGPGTDSAGSSGGHIAPIKGRTGRVFEVVDFGSSPGPKDRNAPADAEWAQHAWRYAFAPNANPPFLGYSSLKVGSFGGPVRDVQKGLGITVDGVFGPVTEGHVRDWQKANGLLADGVVGPDTSKAMLKAFFNYPPDPSTTPATVPTPTPVPAPVPDVPVIDYDELATTIIHNPQFAVMFTPLMDELHSGLSQQLINASTRFAEAFK